MQLQGVRNGLSGPGCSPGKHKHCCESRHGHPGNDHQNRPFDLRHADAHPGLALHSNDDNVITHLVQLELPSLLLTMCGCRLDSPIAPQRPPARVHYRTKRHRRPAAAVLFITKRRREASAMRGRKNKKTHIAACTLLLMMSDRKSTRLNS